ncbi:MAG TPA: ferrochelatase [Desulfobacteraceae bacterium]|nr:ferrochelatase [Desulfobacteraceae bacterium]
MPKYAVILLNLGGPDSISAVEPFLFNLFKDKDIFKIPFGQKLFAGIISKMRAPKVIKKYKEIGGASPINLWTEIQRSMLHEKLSGAFPCIDIYTAMRYWKPAIKDVAIYVSDKGYDKIILLPLYPHYSSTTTGSSFNQWKRYYKGDFSGLTFVNDYFDNKTYILALNKRIDETLLKFPQQVRKKIQLLFSAHGTPLSLVKNGDPYNDQIKKTVFCVMKMRKFSHEHHLCYQSKVGPVKWLQPFADETIKALAAQDKKNILIIPVSFVSDHIETLHELDIEYRKVADKSGIENFMVMEGLNDSETFVSALNEIVISNLQVYIK